ncbi:MAG: hypothetical protein IJE16_04095 [Ruminococcus sp.]|nr:hypothetical protein [Ruminococcus sp.]
MKKFYTEPEIELVNITLVSDVLTPSFEGDVDPSQGTGFNPTENEWIEDWD